VPGPFLLECFSRLGRQPRKQAILRRRAGPLSSDSTLDSPACFVSNMSTFQAQGYYGYAYFGSRITETVALVPVIGMVGNFINDIAKTKHTAPGELVATLVVVGTATPCVAQEPCSNEPYRFRPASPVFGVCSRSQPTTTRTFRTLPPPSWISSS
jgi:hypothetical protein